MFRSFSWLSFVACATILAVPASGAAQSAVEQDRKRIRQHLQEVERKLRAKDVSHLSASEQRARSRNLDRLHRYWKTGVFPHNTRTDSRTPIFIDEEDRDCAVAHLMRESGWEDEARSIASDENLKRLPNMESPEVQAWVEQSGLTAGEATMIQPSYSPCRNCDCEADPVCGSDGETYINECTATKCANVSATRAGCCTVGDDPIVPRETDDSFARGCSDDPTRPDDTGTDDTGTDDAGDSGPTGDAGLHLCPNATWTPDASTGDTGGPEPEPACSTAPNRAPVGWMAALLLGIGGMVFRRRRRR